jgi:Ca-activated chloride channel homolog
MTQTTGRAAVAAAALLAAWAAGCGTGNPAGSGRALYNQATAQLAASNWEEAEKGLLEARDRAGADGELRYRAAFNLGLAYAGHAEAKAAEGPQAAIELLRQAAAWFRDAVRLREDDPDARVNLEVILRRIQALADQLNKGKNRLEARLDRIIEDQRGLRDQIRQLLARVEAAGAAAEPVGFQREFESLATGQRELLAETGTVRDLATDEVGLIENRADDERSPEDKARAVQLQNLDHYLQQAHSAMSGGRGALRRLLAAKAHDSADAALRDLKRAREQLLDPVTVLKSLAEDQQITAVQTGALEQLQRGAVRVEDSDQPAAAPPWLTSAHLGIRQDGLKQRTDELRARLAAGIQAAGAQVDEEAPADDTGADDPARRRLLAAVAEALPLVEAASAGMEAATGALRSDRLGQATTEQGRALTSLIDAIERFAGVRELIELSYREQHAVVALLDPQAAAQAGTAPHLAGIAELEPGERARAAAHSTSRNQDRLERLKDVLHDEQQQREAELSRAGKAGGQPGAAPDPQAAQGLAELYQRAESERAQALAAVERLAGQLRRWGDSGRVAPQAARADAQQALTHIEELRRLFYSVIEHLKELLRNHSELHDQTASAQAAADDQRASLIAPLVDVQQRYAQLGDSLSRALAEQADAAAAQGQQGQQGQQAGPDPQALAEAASEVGLAATQMADAAGLLAEGRDQAATSSYDLEPTLGHQTSAIEHLQAALRLLEPPQEQPNDDQQNQQDQGDQNSAQNSEKDQQSQDQQVSQQQAQRRLQAIRDREAERARSQRERDRMKPEPVEKDW